MSRISLLLACAVAAFGSSDARAQKPPQPNPKDFVDYVAWTNAQFAPRAKDNAAPAHLEAAARAKADDLEMPDVADRTPPTAWTAEDRARLQNLAAEHSAALAKLAAAARQADCYFKIAPENGPLLDTLDYQNIVHVRTLAKLTGARARLRTQADPFSGKPHCYRLRRGEPFLYSVSLDGDDDGGEVYREREVVKHGPTGDFVWWPRVDR